jgi:hypothetical protein
VADRGARPDVTVISLDGGEEHLAVGRPRPPWWRFAGPAVAVVVAFAIGVSVGYEWPGRRPTDPQPADPQPTSTAGGGGLQTTGQHCAVQTATGLWLGAELVNRGPETAVVRGARIVTPLGGLTPTSMVWGSCGEIGAVPAHGPEKVYAGIVAVPESERLWFSASFDLVDVNECPAPYPVQFVVTYIDRTGRLTDYEFGFVDLGTVPHSACER